MIPNPPALLLLEGKGSWTESQVNTALQPPSPTPQERNLSTVLVLDPLSFLAISASEEGCLAEPAKGTLQTIFSELIFPWQSEMYSPSSLQDTPWSLCLASQHQDLAVLGKQAFLSQTKTE